MKTHYCANCETEAVYYYKSWNILKSLYRIVFLCFTCATAFEWGQNNSDEVLIDISDLVEENVEGQHHA